MGWLLVFALLSLLELNDVSLWVPTVQYHVSAEVPCSSLGLEMPARCFRSNPNCCQARNDKGWLERGFLTRLRRVGDGDSGCVLARNAVYDNLVPLTAQEVVGGVGLLDAQPERLLVERGDPLLVLGEDYETLLEHELPSKLGGGALGLGVRCVA